MRPEGFLERLSDPHGGTRLSWQILAVLLALYTASFFSFYPTSAVNEDEAMYIRQARLLVEGRASLDKLDPLTGAEQVYLPATYPIGTAVIMSPFVSAVGWKGAWIASLLSLALGVALCARWLQDAGRSPLFALLLLGSPSALVLGRVGLSDVPSLALVALGLWLFWRGLDRAWPWWLASGFVAGVSLAFRATNPLPFVPFFAGTVLRRELKCWALVVGGLAGVSMRILSSYLIHGDALFERSAYHFAPETVLDRLPFYALALLVFIPGGLVAALAYKGRRRPEVVLSVALFVTLYLFQIYSSSTTGFAKRVLLAPRYLLPILPVIVFAMGESVPRLWRHLVAWWEARERAVPLARIAAVALSVWIAGIACAGVGVHWAFDRWTATQREIRDEIHRHTGDDSVVFTNLPATKKFIRFLDRKYLPVERRKSEPGDAGTLVERHGEFFVVFLDRSDSEWWRADARGNAAFIESLDPPPDLELDRQITPTDRLRIWRVSQVRASGGGSRVPAGDGSGR